MYIILDSDGNITVCRDKASTYEEMYKMKEEGIEPIKTTYVHEGAFKVYVNVNHTKGQDVSSTMQTEMD